MLRITRSAILAVLMFFFHAGLVEAYARCLEVWPNSGGHSETAKSSIQESRVDYEELHCPEEWNHYRLIRAQHSVKKDPRTNRVKANGSLLSFSVAGYVNPGRYSGQRFALLLSPILYPSIAIYQAKVVYRI